MHSFLKEYGVGIVTLVFMAILIAMASPFGIRIREYLLPQLEYASTIGSEEMAKATGGDTSGDDVAAMSSIYACLYTDGELVLSATPIDNTGRTDVDTDFGECEWKTVSTPDGRDVHIYRSNDDYVSSYPTWLAPYYDSTNNWEAVNTDNIKTVNIINKIKPTTCSYWFSKCENLTEIKNMENLDTSECTNMSKMFYNCFSLTNLDVSHFDTSNVTDMSFMFFDINLYDNPNFFIGQTLPTIKNSENSWEILTQYFKENVFDMSNVTNTIAMFYWGIAS